MNTFDELYSKIMSNYDDRAPDAKKPVVDNDKSLSSYELEDEEERIVSSDINCVEDEDSELYDLSVDIEDEDPACELKDEHEGLEDYDISNGLNIDFDAAYADDQYDFGDIEDADLLTEADDDPFAAAPADDAAKPEESADAPAAEGAPAAEDSAGEAKAEETVDPAVKDAASYQVKLDLIVSNITAAFKTTVNSAGSELYDKIIIYGFEESILVFVEDYLKKMMDGDIKINTIEKMDIITFAAPNITQIVKKLIENLAKK